MQSNYWKLAWRQLMKNYGLSIIKIGGLALSIAASLVLLQYIHWQWSFDRFHEQKEHIVRIQNDIYENGVLKQQSAMTYTGIPVIAKEQFPAVKDYVRLARWIANDVVFQYEEKVIRETNFFFADASLFDIFSFRLLRGDPQTALAEPNTIVLTASRAKTLFGSEDPIGKTVIFESRRPFIVTGVVEDPPVQSHIQFGGLASLATMQNWGLDVYKDDHLDYIYTYAYLQLHPATNRTALASALSKTITTLKADSDVKDVFQLQNLEDIHLYSDLQYEITATGKGSNIWTLFGIAVLMLVLAWINHFNLFSAHILDQQKSLSIRRLVGADKKQLLHQVGVAALLYNFIAIGLGIVLAKLSLPFLENSFNIVLGNTKIWNLVASSPAFSLLGFLIFGTVASCILPALIGANTNVLRLFQEQIISSWSIKLRSSLVVFQFTIIICLIISGIVVYQQMRYVEKQDLGIEIENVLALRGPLGTSKHENLQAHLQQFKQAVEAMPNVSTLAVSRKIPSDDLDRIDLSLTKENKKKISLLRNVTDLNFFELYQLPFLAKDTAITTNLTEAQYVVINERAMKMLGFEQPQEALRQQVHFFDETKEIIGVVENHHQRSLHYPIAPILYDIPAGIFATEDGFYSIQLAENADRKTLLPAIQKAYENAFPNTYFDPIEVSEQFANQYTADHIFRRINQSLIGLSLVIAFIGLFGLFMTLLAKRIKEIGIRKILGANIANIVILLSKHFIKLVIIALMFAIPIAYYFMNQWLQNFTYRIDLQWWVFVLAGVVAIGIALLTVSFQSVKAAIANPVQSLRNE
ncbi:MAG: ABC transporter permease [Bacteroidota bacterium]